MIVLETERLRLRWIRPEDAGFIHRLYNEPAFLKFIGDRGLKTAEQAREFVVTRLMESYERHGFGLYLTELKEGGTPVGICGLLKRDVLKDVDVGFAFLQEHWSRGYAYESASAVMSHGRSVLGLKTIVAIAKPDHERSVRLLAKLGLGFERMIALPGGPGVNEVGLFTDAVIVT